MEKHAEAKRAAAVKEAALQSATSSILADEARGKEVQAATESMPAATLPALEETCAEEAPGQEGTVISLQLCAGVQVDLCITGGAEATTLPDGG